MRNHRVFRRVMAVLVVATSILALSTAPGSASAPASAGADLIITQTNGPVNEVLAFTRQPDGALTGPQRVVVGAGTGAYLHTSNAVVALGRRQVLAVNAGDSSVAVLHESNGVLALQGTVATGAAVPVSIAVRGRVAYVLHSGAPFVNPVGPTTLYGPPVIQAISVNANGSGRALAQIRAELPGGCNTYPCTATSIYGGIGVTPNGRSLIVSDTTGDKILTISIREGGQLGLVKSSPSSIPEPYGFATTRKGLTVMSGADHATGDSLASSGVVRNGLWQTAHPTLNLPGGGACWVALSADDRFAYVSNTTPSANFASGGLTTVKVGRQGQLTVVGNAPVPFSPTAFPLDSAVSSDGRHVYVVNAQGVFGFRVAPDGVASYAPDLDVNLGVNQVGFGATGLLTLSTAR